LRRAHRQGAGRFSPGDCRHRPDHGSRGRRSHQRAGPSVIEPDFLKPTRGNAWHLKGDDDRAIADYDEAICLNPRDPCPLYNRGNAWQAKGDHDRAFADYDEAIRLAPNYRCWGEAENI
jgi:tetratricopeptide (TPR) repeat protein